MVDLVELAKELVQYYMTQEGRLAAAGQVARSWDAGLISREEAEAQLIKLGYNTEREEWPWYFAATLETIADECLPQLATEQRGIELARALDDGALPELAALLRPACPADSFTVGYQATSEDDQLVNKLCSWSP